MTFDEEFAAFDVAAKALADKLRPPPDALMAEGIKRMHAFLAVEQSRFVVDAWARVVGVGDE